MKASASGMRPDILGAKNFETLANAMSFGEHAWCDFGIYRVAKDDFERYNKQIVAFLRRNKEHSGFEG